ncbi:Uncharacterised protein [Salmonella enterica subsp. enterica serovar Bovismorbificans]|uniref:Uncharacterized protein n=1 Tax=Salmonella enterica subsp. enterica serovar Bovismorbificans TaxID=58097 RepID=A0A655CHM0_SALET|nr:Uncharacterised protein [Salmonella enterica subsp. enterica serovar Bovismorbificans]
MNIQRPRGRGVYLCDVRVKRKRIDTRQRGDDIFHLQLAAMMKMNAGAQVEAPQ